MKTWPDVNALYQVYPRSFKDANGDGIGDLRGIIEKLDHFKGSKNSLGVDAIWISPIYCSPMKDFGYDVSNHCDIDPIFGTLDDFEELLHEAHRRDIKVMLDFVPNHTSDQHAWFQEALADPKSPKRDYYVWRDPKPDGSPPNNWLSFFGGSTWELEPASGQYYLHSFLSSQPDLNWQNPAVREEMKNVLRFWLDMGVDGVRADAIWYISKDPRWRDNPVRLDTDESPGSYWSYIHRYSRSGPHVLEYLRELTDVVESYPDRFMIFEHLFDGDVDGRMEQLRSLYEVNPRVSAPFNFEGMFLPWHAEAFGEFIQFSQDVLCPGDISFHSFSNHDQSRIVSRFGKEQARLVALLQLTMPGISTIYYGEEIGMSDVAIPQSKLLDKGRGSSGNRDVARTPMQWSDDEYAGFSCMAPWLPTSRYSHSCNVVTEINDDDSFLNLYRQLLGLRQANDILIKGSYTPIKSYKDILAFERAYGDEKYVIVLNFSAKKRDVFVTYSGAVIASTHPARPPHIARNGEVTLRSYEGIVVKL